MATIDTSNYSIIDSNTGDKVDTSSLTTEQVASIISDSLAAGEEGHVRPDCLSGRRVYAIES